LFCGKIELSSNSGKNWVVLLNVRVFSKHRVTTKIWGVNFLFCVVFDLPIKKNSSKNKESESGEIKAIFVHYICCLTCVEKNEGNSFSAKI